MAGSDDRHHPLAHTAGDQVGADIRLGVEATPAVIEAENPDVIILATGGHPSHGDVKGAELAATTWDMLSGKVEPAENILIYDGTGQHHAPSCAEFLAKRGALVEIATQDRMIAEEVGATNQPIHLRELYKLGVVLRPTSSSPRSTAKATSWWPCCATNSPTRRKSGWSIRSSSSSAPCPTTRSIST